MTTFVISGIRFWNYSLSFWSVSPENLLILLFIYLAMLGFPCCVGLTEVRKRALCDLSPLKFSKNFSYVRRWSLFLSISCLLESTYSWVLYTYTHTLDEVCLWCYFYFLYLYWFKNLILSNTLEKYVKFPQWLLLYISVLVVFFKFLCILRLVIYKFKLL